MGQALNLHKKFHFFSSSQIANAGQDDAVQVDYFELHAPEVGLGQPVTMQDIVAIKRRNSDSL